MPNYNDSCCKKSREWFATSASARTAPPAPGNSGKGECSPWAAVLKGVAVGAKLEGKAGPRLDELTEGLREIGEGRFDRNIPVRGDGRLRSGMRLFFP